MENKKKNTVYLIHGFIAAGKTTYAKKLENETGAIRFTKDEWTIALLGINPPADMIEQYDSRMTILAQSVAFKCIKAGLDVILDDGFWVRAQRDEIRRQIIEIGANFQLIYVKCSDEIMKKRALNRSSNNLTDTFYIDEKIYESFKKYFDPLDDDEEHIVVENE